MVTKKGRGGYGGQSAGRSNWVHEECVWRNSQGIDDSVWWVYALSLSGGVLRFVWRRWRCQQEELAKNQDFAVVALVMGGESLYYV